TNSYLSLVTRHMSLIFRCVLDSFDDMLVAGAAAEIAFEAVAYLFARRAGISFEQLRGRHDHAGRAIAALQAVAFPEALLHGMKLAVVRQAFDGRNLRPVRLHRKDRA